jgi:hypothetical protein
MNLRADKNGIELERNAIKAKSFSEHSHAEQSTLRMGPAAGEPVSYSKDG